jgi:hypothetical protein
VIDRATVNLVHSLYAAKFTYRGVIRRPVPAQGVRRYLDGNIGFQRRRLDV